MEPIQLPNSPVIVQTGPLSYTLTFEPLYPGYGVTIGNALRRVLLSSLPGAAVTAMKIKFADHEFSTIPHIKEDAVQIILNVKQLVLKSFSLEPVRLRLQVNKPGEITAADILETDQIQVINKDLHLATLDSEQGELDIEFIIEQGRGYVPVEARENIKYELGMLAVDAIHTPVRAAHFEISSVRVGQMTNFEKLVMMIETNGTLTGQEAFDAAARIITDHLQLLFTASDDKVVNTDDAITGNDEEDTVQSTLLNDQTGTLASTTTQCSSLDTLPLSARARNAFQKLGVSTVEELRSMSPQEIEKMPGLGKKTAAEIMMLLGRE